MKTYEIADDRTGRIYEIAGYRPPSAQEVSDIISQSRVDDIYDITYGNYKGDSLQETQDNLQLKVANYLQVPTRDVDLSSGFWDFENLLLKGNISLRANPQEKLEYIKSQVDGELKQMVVDGKPRMIIDTGGAEGQPRYKFIDTEGFTVSDFADIGGELPRIGASIALTGLAVVDLASRGALKSVTAPFQIGLAGFLADYGTKTIQDAFVGYIDRMDQEIIPAIKGKDYEKKKSTYWEYLAESQQRTFGESSVNAIIDGITFKAGSVLSTAFGQYNKKFANELLKAQKFLNDEYGKEGIKFKVGAGGRKTKTIDGVTMADDNAIRREIDATTFSGSLQRMKQHNLEASLRVTNSLKTGLTDDMSDIQNFVVRNITEDMSELNLKASRGIRNLEDAMQTNLERTLKANAIDLKFSKIRGGRGLQDLYLKSFENVENTKNALYGDVYEKAYLENVNYNVYDVYKAVRDSIKTIKDMPNVSTPMGKVQSEVIDLANTTTKNFEYTKDNLFALTKKKPKKQVGPNTITMKQLDSLISAYTKKNLDFNSALQPADDLKFYKVLQTKLRALRNNKVINPKTGKAYPQFKQTGDSLITAKNYYNNEYAKFFDYGRNGLIARGAGGNIRDDFAMKGPDALNFIFKNEAHLQEYLDLIKKTSITDMLEARKILQRAYMQRMGADGVFYVGKANPITYTRETMDILFREVDPITGVPSKSSALVDAKMKAIDDINALAKKAPNNILSLEMDDILPLFNASTPKQVKNVVKIVEGAWNTQKEINTMMANAYVKQVIDTGDFMQHPDLIAKNLLEMDATSLDRFLKYMRSELEPQDIDRLRASIYNQLEIMAGRNTGNVFKVGDMPLFNPDTMLKIINDNGRVAINARAILGDKVIKTVKDNAVLVRYSIPKEVKQIGEDFRPVFSPAGATLVLSNLPEAVGAKIYGMFATNGMLEALLRKETNPAVIAERMKYIFPMLMATSDGYSEFVKFSTYDAEFMRAMQQEMAGINKEIKETQMLLDYADGVVQQDVMIANPNP